MEASSRQRRQAAIDEYLILLILTINNGRITIASMIFFIWIIKKYLINNDN